MKPPPFDYAAPTTLDEAVALKSDGGDEAVVLAGGQSLVPLLALRLAAPALVIDLNRIPELSYVRRENDWLRVGATARHRDIEDSRELHTSFPLLADALPTIGHRAIRNRGTVGGSLAHADPAAEWPAVALALDAEVEAVGRHGQRIIAANEFFVAPFTNALAPDEILREVRFRFTAPHAGSAFAEHARGHGAFALAGVAAVIVPADDGRVGVARLALMGVGGTPIRVPDAEQELEGQPVTDERIQAAAEMCRGRVDPPSDVHGSARYRRHLVGVLVERAVRAAAQRARWRS